MSVAVPTSPRELDRAGFDALCREVRELHAQAMRSAWKMGRVLDYIQQAKHLWAPLSWCEFCQQNLGFTGDYAGAYTIKLIDVSRDFSEADVVDCGTAKLIKILTVPAKDRAQFVALARTKSAVEVRAAVNRYTLERSEPARGGGRVLPQPRQGRRKEIQIRRQVITHVNAAEQIVALYATPRTNETAMRRAKRVEDRPVGRVLLGGKAFTLALRNTEGGLVVGIGLENPEAT